MNKFKKQCLLMFLLIAVTACSHNQSSRTPNQNNSKVVAIEKGKASFYADKYQGRQTANGERFKQTALTAAHKKLKFGTWVKVINANNGKSVTVRINDRGPFIKGRIINLSKSAFSAIANQREGVVDVIVEILK